LPLLLLLNGWFTFMVKFRSIDGDALNASGDFIPLLELLTVIMGLISPKFTCRLLLLPPPELEFDWPSRVRLSCCSRIKLLRLCTSCCSWLLRVS